jgi:hypothetical protein
VLLFWTRGTALAGISEALRKNALSRHDDSAYSHAGSEDHPVALSQLLSRRPWSVVSQAHLTYWIWMMFASAAATADPYPQSAVIADLQFDFSRFERRAAESDNWAVTWAADDNQYAAWGDGYGFDLGTTKISLGYSRVTGTASSWTARDVFGTELAEARSNISGKSYAILAIGATLYSFVSPGSENENLTRATLYKSTDGGHTWAATSVVFTAGTHGLGLPGFLQFGKGYAGARDGYVYTYWTRLQSTSWGIQKPGEIWLTRVPVSDIESMSQYQFFSGLDGSGNPGWTSSVSSGRAVFVDGNGVMIPSVIYHPGLERYLLTTCHTAWMASNFGIHDAPQPWGPWTTVRYYTGWPSAGQVEKYGFYGNFSSKWMDTAGNGFVFIFTGTNSLDSWNSVPGTFVRFSGTSDLTPPAAPTNLHTRQ